MPLKYRANTKNLQFNISTSDDGWSHEAVQCVVLMDIRDELQRLNALLECPNFIGIPTTLRSIRRALPKQPKKAKE